MEKHPEQNSESKRLALRQRISSEFSKISHDRLELAYNLLDLRSSDDILDIGCGLGEFLIKVRSKGHLGRLVALDCSTGIIDEARENVKKALANIELMVGNAESLPFRGANFDCVTALHVISRSDPGKALSEIGRILKVDGRVVISTNSRSSYPILDDLKNRARERFGWLVGNEWVEDLQSDTAREILRGFFSKVEETRYEDVLQYPDAEVLVDFFRSIRGLWSPGLTEEEWDRIIDWVRGEALEIIPEHGYAEDPKSFSLFRCTGPLGL